MNSLPDGYYEYLNLTFDFLSNGYFAANPTAHIFVCVRQDPALVGKQIRGQGIVLGNVSLAPGGTPFFPSTQIETWCNGIYPGSYLLSAPGAPPILEDGVIYTFQIFTHVTPDRSVQTIRYRVWQGSSMLYDSGNVTDPNQYFDPAHSGAYAGHVFDTSTDPGWGFTIDNVFLSTTAPTV
ncbi:hypothetical protein [Curvibacter lanceolatus]|uniref:hypothetical protein n=1 Tax=Curvibacter lanceolatus TaxID=86182 RepID=UPI00036E57F5|nr:hypothetical protein [Curvibacter lanceolatus]